MGPPAPRRRLCVGFGGQVVEVVAAVAQLAVVQVGFFGSLACQLGDAGYGFALFFAFVNLLLDDFGYVGVAV